MIDTHLADDVPAATNRNLRQFAAVWLLLFGALAFASYSRQDSSISAVIFAGLAALGLIGLVRPATIKPVFLSALVVTFPLGWVMSHLLLAVLFYGVFTPLALFFRLIGRDAIGRRRRTRETHWVSRPSRADVRSYFRQS